MVQPKRPISGRVDRTSATKRVNLVSILGRVKLNIIKIGILNFPAWRYIITEIVRSLHRKCGKQITAWLKDCKVPLQSPGQANLVKKM